MSVQKLCCCLKSALDKQEEGIEVEVNCVSSCCASSTSHAIEGRDECDGKIEEHILQHKPPSQLQSTRSSSSCFGCGDKEGEGVAEESTSVHIT